MTAVKAFERLWHAEILGRIVRSSTFLYIC